MHILFITAEYPPQPGGVGDYTRQLGTALLARGHAVAVLTISNRRWTMDDMSGAHHNNPRALDSCSQPNADWGWRSWRGIIAAIDQVRPDRVHIQYQTGAYGMHPAINFLPWRLRALPSRPPIVVTFHDLLEPYLFPKAGPLRRWVTQRLARDADGVIVTNADDLKQIEDWRSRNKFPNLQIRNPVSLIPIGSNIPVAPPEDVDREQWRQQLGILPHELLVGYFGLLGRSKGADLIIEAMKHEPHWKVVLIGGEATAPQDQAYAADLLTQIERQGLGGRVMRTGQVNEAAVSAYLMAADVVALPFRDGASFRRGSLLAALAHGCALVTTHPQESQAAKDALPALRDGQHALLIPTNDAQALHDAIKRLAHDSHLRSHLGAEAKELAASFDWTAIAEQHEMFYLSIGDRVAKATRP